MVQGLPSSARAEASSACPVCHESDWERVSACTYRRDTGGLSAYRALRQRVLFEVWYPSSETVTLHVELCRRCGFVCFHPRPSEEQLDAKYQFLAAHEDVLGGSAASALGRCMDERRAERTFSALAPVVNAADARVLDYGGGNGKIAAPFRQAGARCYLVDYNQAPLPWIERLGNTIDDLQADERFDAIICSHVFEHLAEPAALAERLKCHLDPAGAMYVEVPLEIWRGVPIRYDPVTHVNFFTLASLEQLLVRHGFEVIEAKEINGNYGEVVIPVAAVVVKPGVEKRVLPDPVAAARQRLHPGPASWIGRLAGQASRAALQVRLVAACGGIRDGLRALAIRARDRRKGSL